MDVLWASFVGGEAAHDRTDGGLRAVEETERVGRLPRIHPLRLQSGVAWGVVLHQELDGDTIPAVHRKEAGEAR